MKYFFRLLLLLALPLSLHAQDTTVLKQYAAMTASALIKGNYDVIVDNTYPHAVLAYGGRQQMIKMLAKSADKMKEQQVTLTNVIIGSPGKFYNTATEIQCLVPESLTIKENQIHMVKHTWVLAISADGGKRWYFVDLNTYGVNNLHTMVPDLSKDIVIPKLEKVTYYSN